MFKRLTLFFIFSTTYLFSNPLTLQDALDIALEKNISIQSTKIAIDKSLARRQEAFSYVLPKLNYDIDYNRSESFQTRQFTEIFSGSGFGSLYSKVNEIAATVNVDEISQSSGSFDITQESYTTAVTLTQPIFSGQAWPAIQAATIDIMVKRNQLEEMVQETLFNVLSSYLSVLTALNEKELSEESLAVLEEEHIVITGKYNEGIISKTEYLQSQLAIESESLHLLQAEKVYRLALAGLKTMLNLEDSYDLSVVNLELVIDDTPEFDSSEMLERAFNSRYDLDNAAKQIEMLKLTEIAYHRRSWLSLDFVGKYGYGDSESFSFEDENEDWFVGINGSLPLFTGFAFTAQQKQYALDIENAEYQYSSLRHGVSTQVKESLYTYSVTEQQLLSSERQYELAQEIFDSQETSFQNGIIAYDDYLEALLDLKRAKLDISRSRYEWLEAICRVYKDTAQLTPSTILKYL